MANVVERIIGFETGDANEIEATAGTFSIQSTIKRTGGYALRVNPALTATGSARIAGFNATGAQASIAAATGYFSFYFYIATAPAANDEEFVRAVSSTNTLKSALRLTSGRKIALYDSANALAATGSTTLALNTWYRIDFKSTNSTSAATDVRINGVTELTTTINHAATNVTRFTLGKTANSNGQSVDFYYDDAWLDSSDFAPAGTFQVDRLLPASTSSNQFTGGTGASDYTQIDEVPIDVADYIEDPAAAATVTAIFGIQSFATVGINASTTIRSLQLIYYSEDAGVATPNTLAAGIRSNATDSLNSNLNTSAAPVDYGRVVQVDPDGGGAWTKTKVEAALIKFVENTSTVNTRIYFAMVNIAHTPPASSQTITGRSRINVVTSQTITGRSRITATTNQTILGRSRLTNTSSQTIQGLSRIQSIVLQTILGQSRITTSVVQTILGRSNIAATSTQNITALARILVVVNQAITGKSRITQITPQTIQGKSNISSTTLQTILGRGSITFPTKSQTITGRSHICVDQWQTDNETSFATANSGSWYSRNIPDWFLEC